MNTGTKVAFQGEPGAYSEEAVYAYFGSTANAIPCRTFSSVFKEVNVGTCEYGVVPIENSIEGSINQVYDLFLKYDLGVTGEIALRIVHCLIADNKTRLDDVKTVYSHPQALAQCRSFLERGNYDLVSTYDTAGSVKMLREQNLVNAAAIASERAAEIYDSKILIEDIADNLSNYTRFFVLSKSESFPTGDDKTSVIFSAKHVPGALHAALGEFATRGINLTKIESRPTKQTPWEYNFYLDFEGHQTDKACEEALDGLRFRSVFVKVLGSYPRAK